MNTVSKYILPILMSVCFAITLSATDYYVTVDGRPITADGSKWSNGVTSLAAALDNAVAGDTIHMLGYNADSIGAEHVYRVTPDKLSNGFTLKPGVSLIGGYAPDGTRPTSRGTMRFTYRSVLTADIQQDDAANRQTVIFPTNQTRSDNAHRVLTLDVAGDAALETVIDGLIIEGGNADGENGGGIYVTNSQGTGGGKFTIRNCFISNNYAKLGGGVYVDASCSATGSKITNCLIANNVAGTAEAETNSGAGVCVMGTADVTNTVINNNKGGGALLGSRNGRIINVTFARNSVAAVDVAGSFSELAMPEIYNSVMWNNEALSSVRRPALHYCAFHNPSAEDISNGNTAIDEYNALETAASTFFTIPSELLGYEFVYQWQGYNYPHSNWSISERSALCNKGSNEKAAGIGNDMNGNQRIVDGTVDIGAFEAYIAGKSQIFHVSTNGNDNNDGLTWGTAKKTVQAAIDAAALSIRNSIGEHAEVWIEAGTYYPNQYIAGERVRSFRMRERVNVYGGFKGNETSKSERPKGDMPWKYTYETQLCGANYKPGDVKWNPAICRWESSTSLSSHVVWFAPLQGEQPFSRQTILEGVTIIGGNASYATQTTADYYDENCGGGLYIGYNAMVENCIVTECIAKNNGGAAYVAGGGRVRGSLICSNSAQSGGGIYVDKAGSVTRSMLTNNGAANGAAVYMKHTGDTPNDLILASSLINNNSVTSNGAVYCDKGGMIVHATITNNNSTGTVDESSGSSPRTGGVYADSYVYMVNSLLWNNSISQSPVSVYITNPSRETTQFYNSAISNINSVVWNNTLQQNLLSLSETNTLSGSTSSGIIAPAFVTGNGVTDATLKENIGVNPSQRYSGIDYFWQPRPGSALRSKGLPRFAYSDNAIIKNELDLKGEVFARKPAVGALHINQLPLKPARDNNKLILHVDNSTTRRDGDGSTWATAHRSLNEALQYFSDISLADNGVPAGIDTLEVRVLEGIISPSYKFDINDLRAASIEVGRSNHVIKVVGSYSADEVHAGNNTPSRLPGTYHTVIHGNADDAPIDNALFHCVRVNANAKVVFDGIYFTGANAKNDRKKFGAGILVDDGSTVELRNSMIINCQALDAPAVSAPNATVKMVNTVVANNSSATAAATTSAVIAGTLTLNHCSFLLNACTPYSGDNVTADNCLCAGNVSSSLETEGVTVCDNTVFLNPTKTQGASVGLETYGGGYPLFVPLTSSPIAANHIINRASASAASPATDFLLQQRNLGGVPDLGAFEAELPARGRVYYVRTPEKGGNDSNDGLSWATAFATIGKALDEAEKGEVISGAKPEVWVAAGTYSADPKPGSKNCFVIRDGVNVYGAFPATGNPSKADRHPLVSQYVKNIGSDNPADYETILQPATIKEGIGRVLGQPDQYNPFFPGGTMPTVSTPGYYKYFYTHDKNLFGNDFFDLTVRRKLVHVGSGKGDHIITYNTTLRDERWREVGSGKGDYMQYRDVGWLEVTEDIPGAVRLESDVQLKFQHSAEWDGFTVINGSLNSRYIPFLGENGRRNGGSGVSIFGGVSIRNFVVCDNENYFSDATEELRGGGVYCDGGSIVNTYIVDNRLGASGFQKPAFGGGVYMYSGSAYNCVIARNECTGTYADGAGIFIENAEFYNNTIVQNVSHGSERGNGGICIYQSGASSNLVVYNCIVTGNTADMLGSYKDANVASHQGNIVSYNSIYENTTIDDSKIKFEDCTVGGLDILTKTDGENSGRDYRLNGSAGLNTGENMPEVNGRTINLFEFTDMDYTDRVKDCTVDAGAFEYDNSENIVPDVNGVYYVTYAGNGSADASSPETAACAQKLQDVLNAAGRRIANAGNVLSVTATVKIAGYPANSLKIRTYKSARRTDSDDLRSLTYTIPYGVTVMGGYSEDFHEADNARDASKRVTVLSPEMEYSSLSLTGYHVLTFAPPAEGLAGRQTVIDGLVLDGGRADASAVGPNQRGGAAIVPAYGHIRNCIIRNCSAATDGGALYLMPGATVSGTFLYENSAQRGGALYASNENASKDLRTHLFSNTVYKNSASEGGGLYFEDNALVGFNCVFFGNTADADANISGATGLQCRDNLLSGIIKEAGMPFIEEFFPFNKTFVEKFELAANYINYKMTESFSVYFRNNMCQLRSFSPLVKSGMRVRFQVALQDELGISAYDMYGLPRKDDTVGDDPNNVISAGACAFTGGQVAIPENPEDIIDILFVKQGLAGEVSGSVLFNDYDSYIGRSFLTPFTDLDKALSYVKAVRAKDIEGAKDTRFVIFMAGGVYKPAITRDPDEGAELRHDQRRNSFVVPAGVDIYGGFVGDEKLDGLPVSCGLDALTPVDGDIIALHPLDIERDLPGLLASRTRQDNNNNGLFEPWEFAQKTIFSGEISVSLKEKNVYHVVLSNDTAGGSVILDGITVMRGETAEFLGQAHEIGRGGALFSNNVDYDIRNCRFIDNKAVRGNAVFMKNASLKVSGSLFAANSTISGYSGSGENTEPAGGAVYGHYDEKSPDSLIAVNSIFVNNEVIGTDGRGAAIASNRGALGYKMKLMNCIVARNAAPNSVFHVSEGAEITNTVVWGNNINSEFLSPEVPLVFSHSATDLTVNPEHGHTVKEFIPLSKQNMAVNGPRFTSPSETATADGFDISLCRWNPLSLSVLTDAGDGSLDRSIAYDENVATGAYSEFIKRFGFDVPYIHASDNSPLRRYEGRILLDNEPADKNPLKIDIGLYEYIYRNDLTQKDTIYVDLEDRGQATGDDWANAISSIDDAIRAVCMSTGGTTTDKCIMVRGGNFSLSQLVSGVAFRLHPRRKAGDADMVTSITIKGAFDATTGTQNFAKPTTLQVNPVAVDETIKILELASNGVDINIEGIQFGDYSYNFNDPDYPELIGLELTPVKSTTDNRGTVRISNSRIVHNDKGLNFNTSDTETGSRAILSNILVADNDYGISIINDNIKNNMSIVNGTLANNQRYDISILPESVYNTVSYKNGTDNLTTDEGKHNLCLSEYENNDILRGPNFMAPDAELPDYSIRPSYTLLNTGSNNHYTSVTGVAADNFSNEKDLAGLSRFVGDVIDIGAFEYNSDMFDTVYVKTGVLGDNSGRDWENAMSDLQTAIDHAGVYAAKNENTGENTGVVIVHPNVSYAKPLSVSLGNIKVYGSMTNGDRQIDNVTERGGILGSNNRSTISNRITVTAASETDDPNVLFDGFEFTATTDNNPVSLGQKTMVSTSIVNGDVTLDGNVLYNSLLLGNVEGLGTVVNCTARENIGTDNSVTSVNSVPSCDSVPDYVPEEMWRYQLRDTSEYIDRADENVIQEYIDRVGHEKDITGAARRRNATDFGCFETYNIPASASDTLAADDMPTEHHVVYVRRNAELWIGEGACPDESHAFSPAFLLLENGGELLGNGNFVSLKNFGVEHDLKAGEPQLISLPFNVTDLYDGQHYMSEAADMWNEISALTSVMRYDGAIRAAHDYVFQTDSSLAWVSVSSPRVSLCEGLLLEPKKNATLRFMGTEYIEEPGKTKPMTLFRYNYNEPWSDGDNSVNRFTHAENMSWNLVGSPYLSAMNYDDMEYGRMIYKWSNLKYYTPVNTAAEGVSGHLPRGNAFFTQTATLRESETVEVSPRTETKAKDAVPANMLAVALRYMDGDNANLTARTAETAVQHDDRINLTAVAPDEASSEYNINTDAVKMNSGSTDADEIYIVRQGRRYSILEAMDVTGSVHIGIAVSHTGNYCIYIPEDSHSEQYEVVALHDNKNNKTVDLKETEYHFHVGEAGTIDDRFSITFKRSETEEENGSDPVVYSPARGVAVVDRLDPETEYCIRIYDATGRLAAMRTVRGTSAEFMLKADAAYLFEITPATNLGTSNGRSDSTAIPAVTIHKLMLR